MRENLFHVNKENWDGNTPSNCPKVPDTKFKGRERKSPSRGIIQECAPPERCPCAPKLAERSHEETLHQERCAGRAPWDFAKNIHKLKNADKATFHALVEARILQTIPAWQVSKVNSKRGVILEAPRDKKKVHVVYTDGHLSSQKMRS